MSEHVTKVQSSQARALVSDVLGGIGCEDFGLVLVRGAKSWREVPDKLPFVVGHDEREAPYVVDGRGDERKDMLVSLADEDDLLACTWARVGEGSPLVGLGIDLASTRDFDERPSSQHFIRLLFSDVEHDIVRGGLFPFDGCPDELSYASVFGAKEAAFKATAAPLRRWYDVHDEELAFEVRHFEMTSAGIERGEGRDAAAQRAMDEMGIARIEVRACEVEGMAFVLALALA